MAGCPATPWTWRLERAYASPPKRWVTIAGADHNDLELLAGRQMIGEVVAFLRENAPKD
jgi:hypothetical protein